MTTDLLNTVYPDLRVRMRRVYSCMFAQYKLMMRCDQGLRTWDEQDRLYALGRTTAGSIVTYARGGESFHNFGCAVDSCFIGADPYMEKSMRAAFYWSEYARFCKGFGLRVGADFTHPDRSHAEITYGLNLIDLQEIYDIGKLPGVWMQFDKIRGQEPGKGD